MPIPSCCDHDKGIMTQGCVCIFVWHAGELDPITLTDFEWTRVTQSNIRTTGAPREPVLLNGRKQTGADAVSSSAFPTFDSSEIHITNCATCCNFFAQVATSMMHLCKVRSQAILARRESRVGNRMPGLFLLLSLALQGTVSHDQLIGSSLLGA